MSFPQRLAFFILGIALGSVLAGYLMQRSRVSAGREAEAKAVLAPVGAEAIQRAAVPGIIRAYNQRQVPMQSEYIKSEVFVEGQPQPGLTERYLLLRGMETEQVLGIREVAATGADPVWGQLEDVRILAANRVRVRVAPGVSREQFAAALAPLDMHIVRGLATEASADPSVPMVVTLPEGERMETPPDVPETDFYLVGFPLEAADSARQAQAALAQLDAVASVEFDYLDATSRFERRSR